MIRRSVALLVREVLLQVAVSNLPVPGDELTQTLADTGLASQPVTQAAQHLVDLSRLVDLDGELWVHRWTAQALKDHQPERRIPRALPTVRRDATTAHQF